MTRTRPEQLAEDDYKYDVAMTDKDWERFWIKVEKTDRCWNWLSTKSIRGYGCFSVRSWKLRAHRLIYHKSVAKVPPHKVIDHLCKNTRCVNPSHLEAVTIRENTLRGVGPSAKCAAQTHCKYGHPFVPGSYYLQKQIHGFRRRCKICCKAYDKKRRSKSTAPATKKDPS